MFASTRYPKMPAPNFRDGSTPTYNDLGYYEIYKDQDTMTYRSIEQDKEIAKLKFELQEKQKTTKLRLENLIAYYYKRN
jgi:hypothetical protein